MQLIPAVDIRKGRCVRLRQGRIDEETVYDRNPTAAALRWADQGARRLHIVDLDGAFGGRPRNMELILEIAECLDIPVQVGGGIRTLEVMEEYVEAGVDRVIVGTLAVKQPDLVGKAVKLLGTERIAVGIDYRRDQVAIEGWETPGGKPALEVALDMKSYWVEHLVYTDITRDGTLAGVKSEEIAEFVSRVEMQTIVSGGIGSLCDLKEILSLNEDRIEGIIVGQALYTGRIEFEEAQMIVEGSDC